MTGMCWSAWGRQARLRGWRSSLHLLQDTGAQEIAQMLVAGSAAESAAGLRGQGRHEHSVAATAAGLKETVSSGPDWSS